MKVKNIKNWVILYLKFRSFDIGLFVGYVRFG